MSLEKGHTSQQKPFVRVKRIIEAKSVAQKSETERETKAFPASFSEKVLVTSLWFKLLVELFCYKSKNPYFGSFY